MTMLRILLVDNHDSFVHNVRHALAAPGVGAGRGSGPGRAVEVRVVRPGEVEGAGLVAWEPHGVVISPGPRGPADASLARAAIVRFAGRVPVLGICLGHQCLADAGGLVVRRTDHPMHGRTTPVHHDGRGIFAGLPDPFPAARYHSLVVDAVIPSDRRIGRWQVSAWTADGLIMGLRRPALSAADEAGPAVGDDAGGGAAIDGIQFHPESFLTPDGPRLLACWLERVRSRLAVAVGGPEPEPLVPTSARTPGTSHGEVGPHQVHVAR